jgi:hypothetical protein
MYKEYRGKGLEVVALMLEHCGDFERAARQPRDSGSGWVELHYAARSDLTMSKTVFLPIRQRHSID